MGLDTTHNCWHGPYSAFSRFRNALVEAAGIPLTGDGRFDSADIDWDQFKDGNFYGEWQTPPDDPLYILIVHSDCEGVIKAEHAPHLAERIEQLIPSLPPDGPDRDRWQAAARLFVYGLRQAAAANEDVGFM